MPGETGPFQGIEQGAEHAEQAAGNAAQHAQQAASNAAQHAQQAAGNAAEHAQQAASHAQQAASQAADKAQSAATQAASRGQQAATQVADKAQQAVDKAQSSATQAADKAQQAASNAEQHAQQAASNAEQKAQQAASNAEQKAQQAASNAEQKAQQAASNAEQKAQQVEQKAQQAATQAEQKAQQVEQKAQQAATQAEQKAQTAVNNAEQKAQQVEQKAQQAATQAEQKAQTAVNNAEQKAQQVEQKAQQAATQAEQKAQTAVNNVEQKAQQVEQKAQQAVNNAEQKAQQAVNNVEQKAQQVEQKAQQAVNKAEQAVSKAEQKAEQAVNKVEQQAQQAVNKAEQAVSKAEQKAEQAVNKVEQQAQQAVNKAEQAVNKAEQQAEQAVNKAEQAVNKAEQKAEQAVDKAEQAVNKAEQKAEQAVDKAEQAVNKVEQKAEQAVNKAEQAVDKAEQKVEQGIDQVEKDVDKLEQKAEQAIDKAEQDVDKLEQKAEQAIDKVEKDVDKLEQKAEQAVDKAEKSVEQAIGKAKALVQKEEQEIQRVLSKEEKRIEDLLGKQFLRPVTDALADLDTAEVAFVSGAASDDDVRLIGLVGRERLSRLYEFDLVITRAEYFTESEIEALLKSPCAVTMGPRKGAVVHGVLESVRLLDSDRNTFARYALKLVPTVWLLTLARTNRLFQDLTIPDIVKKILTQYGLSAGSDFEILVSGAAPKREYVVQYNETDWDFIQRWLEHEGFFYWFEHGETCEKLVISNSNQAATPIDGPPSLSYRDPNNLSSGNVSTVWDVQLRQRRIPARLAVYDYNYRVPTIDLLVKKDVDTKNGFGSVFFYGEHFKDNDQGAAIAKVRAQRMLTEQKTLTGRTDCWAFRVGHAFELENHHLSSLDKKYLITGIEHHAGHPIEEIHRGEVRAEKRRYQSTFEAIPLDTQFRPERITPWPRIHGVLHAHIDADGAGDYAQIDDQGRYKVRIPFDGGDARGSKASRWIRLAEPYAGKSYGAHFPLHKGTEVLVAHIDGDPDRPLIIGAVPNTHTVSPSTSANATQSVVMTASGIRIELEDLQS